MNCNEYYQECILQRDDRGAVALDAPRRLLKQYDGSLEVPIPKYADFLTGIYVVDQDPEKNIFGVNSALIVRCGEDKFYYILSRHKDASKVISFDDIELSSELLRDKNYLPEPIPLYKAQFTNLSVCVNTSWNSTRTTMEESKVLLEYEFAEDIPNSPQLLMWQGHHRIANGHMEKIYIDVNGGDGGN